MENSNNQDMLGIERLLSVEERQIRDSVRDFVNAEIVPITKQHFRDAIFPEYVV